MFDRAVRFCVLACVLATLAGCSGGGGVVVASGTVGTGTLTAGSTKWKSVGTGGVFEVEGFAMYYTPAQPVTCPVVSVTLTVFKDKDRDGKYDPQKDALVGNYTATGIPGSANGAMQAGVGAFSYNPADDGPVMLHAKVCYGAPCEGHCVEASTRLELKK